MKVGVIGEGGREVEVLLGEEVVAEETSDPAIEWNQEEGGQNTGNNKPNQSKKRTYRRVAPGVRTKGVGGGWTRDS